MEAPADHNMQYDEENKENVYEGDVGGSAGSQEFNWKQAKESVSDMDEVDEEQIDADIKLISALEDYWGLPDFTDAMANIMNEHAHKFSSAEEEQDLEWYSIYKQYIKTIEELLKKFLEDQGVSEEDLYAWWNRVSEHEIGALSCIDYLVATSEYSEFWDMMVQHHSPQSEENDDFLNGILNMKFEPPKKREE